MRKHCIKPLIIIITLILLLTQLAGLGCGGGGGKIAYIRSGGDYPQLVIVDPDGSNETVLADYAQSACISPDGTKVVYYRLNYFTDDEDYGTYMIDSDGQNNTKLTGRGGSQYAWSPDGTKLAYVGGNIYTMNADGTNETRLVPMQSLSDVLSQQMSPTWSPDGTKIAFTAHKRSTDDVGIYIINADGSGLQLLDDTADYEMGSVAWSPDGSKLACTHNLEEIHILNSDGTNPKTILTCGDIDGDTRMLFYLKWSPDGRNLIFAARYDSEDDPVGGFRICTVGANGSNARILADDIRSQGYPSWGR